MSTSRKTFEEWYGTQLMGVRTKATARMAWAYQQAEIDRLRAEVRALEVVDDDHYKNPPPEVAAQIHKSEGFQDAD